MKLMMRPVMRLRRATSPVYRITGARRGLSEDVTYRQRRYIISMGIRTVCFVMAMFVHGPPRFVMLTAAVILPYVAVVFANGGREPAESPVTTAFTDNRQALGRPALGPGKKANQS